jgi:hypothetical protein
MPMIHVLPDLPYDLDALEPHISRETLAIHYGEHHSAYVKKLNSLTQNDGFSEQPLEDIVKYATGDIFHNAAQAWNHEFYWNCLSPQGGGEPVAAIAEAIQRDFKSFEQFREEFTQAAMQLRCLGTRLLPGLQEPATGVSRSVLVSGELAFRQSATAGHSPAGATPRLQPVKLYASCHTNLRMGATVPHINCGCHHPGDHDSNREKQRIEPS